MLFMFECQFECEGQGGACLGRPAKPASGRSSSVVLSLVSQVFSSRVFLLLKGLVLMARVHLYVFFFQI